MTRRPRSPAARARSFVARYATYLGRSRDSRATIAKRLPAKLAAIADALPPPGTGSAEARTSENSERVSPVNESPTVSTARLSHASPLGRAVDGGCNTGRAMASQPPRDEPDQSWPRSSRQPPPLQGQVPYQPGPYPAGPYPYGYQPPVQARPRRRITLSGVLALIVLAFLIAAAVTLLAPILMPPR